MMDTTFKLDLKTLVMIVTFATGLAGVYYSFQSRLDTAEYQIKSTQSEIGVVRERLDNMDKRINRLKKNINKAK